jgi:hypothetical protein
MPSPMSPPPVGAGAMRGSGAQLQA